MAQIICEPSLQVAAEDDSTELVPALDPRSQVISIDLERMWGTPCLAGSRVPVKSLFDHLERGHSLEQFLDDFEGVPRDVCVRALHMAFDSLMNGLPNAR